MADLQRSMQEYRAQLQKGEIQAAYRGLMDYMQSLRAHFKKRCPEAFVSSSIYAGVMDMTYFSIVPEAFKARGLKIALVFLHQAFRFEVWLSGVNRPVQAQYWQQIKAGGQSPYRLVADPLAADAVLEHTLVEDPNFSDLDALTAQIERGTLDFMRETGELLDRLEG